MSPWDILGEDFTQTWVKWKMLLCDHCQFGFWNWENFTETMIKATKLSVKSLIRSFAWHSTLTLLTHCLHTFSFFWSIFGDVYTQWVNLHQKCTYFVYRFICTPLSFIIIWRWCTGSTNQTTVSIIISAIIATKRKRHNALDTCAAQCKAHVHVHVWCPSVAWLCAQGLDVSFPFLPLFPTCTVCAKLIVSGKVTWTLFSRQQLASRSHCWTQEK